MIAITGAAGFIGSNLAHALAADGAELLLVDHPLTAAKLKNWLGLNSFRYCDHTVFLDLLRSSLVKPDCIFHLGACSSTTELNWNYLKTNNIEYSQILWQWCSQHRKPFIYASSAATYGNGSRGYCDSLLPSELEPLNLYGKSKNDFDLWALLQKETPPRWAGLKFFNVYGPQESHKGRMASVVYQAWRQIRETGRVKLFRSNDPGIPDGDQSRDFVFVGDCVNHLRWQAKNDGPGGLFNSGTGQARTFLDLTVAVFRAMKMPVNISYISMPPDLSRQYQNYTQATMQKLQSTGYSLPATSLESGVQAYIDWLENYETTDKPLLKAS